MRPAQDEQAPAADTVSKFPQDRSATTICRRISREAAAESSRGRKPPERAQIGSSPGGAVGISACQPFSVAPSRAPIPARQDRGQRRCAARPRLLSLRPSGTPCFATALLDGTSAQLCILAEGRLAAGAHHERTFSCVTGGAKAHERALSKHDRFDVVWSQEKWQASSMGSSGVHLPARRF